MRPPVPVITQLESIRDLELDWPAAAAAFDNGCGDNSMGNPGCTVLTCSCTYPVNHCTSSTPAFLPTHAWFVMFYGGEALWDPKTETNAVRAVRGGL